MTWDGARPEHPRLDIGHFDQIAEHIRPLPKSNLPQFSKHLPDIGNILPGILLTPTVHLILRDHVTFLSSNAAGWMPRIAACATDHIAFI
jgi:hypothetical protein